MNSLSMKTLLFTIIALMICTLSGLAQSNQPVGTIKGQVLDRENKQPVIGAAVMIKGTQLGASADQAGNFTIANVTVGAYVVQITALGYEPLLMTDVIVRTQRPTVLNPELKETAIESGEVTITPSYYAQTEDQPVSTTGLSYEEIRRSPGSMGDVSRIIMSLPSVSKVNDTRNNLVVRGGSPSENGYTIDNIPVPNINHFPLQGASSGALGMVNVDLIQDVTFQAGGYSAAYGDKLSSVMDLTLREGNRDEFDGQVDFNFMGVGGIVEGPLAGKKGSWILSAHRSYLDFVVDAFNIEASAAPYYADIFGKASVDLSPKNKLTFMDLLGMDHSRVHKSRSIDNKENVYGDADWNVNTLGINWRSLWGAKGYSNTSLSHNITDWKSEWYETLTDSQLTRNRSTEQDLTLKNSNHWLINSRNSLEFGIEGKINPIAYDNTYFATTDLLGNPVPELRIKDDASSMKAGGYASYRTTPLQWLTLTPGVRYDYFDYNSNAYVSPRLQVACALSQKTTVSVSYGQYAQFLPMILLSQNSGFKKLKDPVASHYVLGFSHLLTEDTRLTVEGYYKDYRNLPLDPEQPQFSVIDQSNDQDGYTSHSSLVDNGKAYSSGVEAMVQKKLATNIYGLVSGSYSRARYQGYDGQWRDRIYDNRYLITIAGGYRPNNRWEFSVRWVYAGGAPYTPFDQARSAAVRRGIYDEQNVNQKRLPDYHTMDVRVDRRFNLASSNLIVYLSVANVYNRENLAQYYWNQIDNKQDKMLQWGMIPVLGLEFEY
jgi:hypothetical protein